MSILPPRQRQLFPLSELSMPKMDDGREAMEFG
jgi:hypothetical protein